MPLNKKNQTTDSFVVSQLISMARHAKCFKLGSKTGWLYASQIPYHRDIDNLSVSVLIVTCIYIYYLHIRLNGYWGAQFIRKALHYAWVTTANSSRECSTLGGRSSFFKFLHCWRFKKDFCSTLLKFIKQAIYIYIYIYI